MAKEPVVPLITDRIFLSVRSRRESLFEGDVKSISSFNQRGTFDVMPQHSHFISIIQKTITIHKLDGQEQTIKITNGVMHVEENKIKVYLE